MLLSGPELGFAMGVVFLSSAVAGLVGFGMGMMLSPLLLLVLEPEPVVLAVNTLSFVGLAMIGVKGGKKCPRKRLGRWLLLGCAGSHWACLCWKPWPPKP